MELLMKLYGNEQALISADIDKLMSIKRVSDICKINELRSLYEQVEGAVENLHYLCVTADNYSCLLIHILKDRLPEELKLISRKL